MANNEFGDFQTPPELIAKIVRSLPRRRWARVLEPTCGVGNFLRASAAYAPEAQAIGIELQPAYAEQARRAPAEIIEADIFAMDLGDLPWTAAGPMLVVGNPPWVTNAQLTVLASSNRPERLNLRSLGGYDAMTGAANFDIAESVWLKLITGLREHSPTISLLCKTQVARNVLEFCWRFGLPVSSASLRLVDARKWFGVSVGACLFTMEVGTGPPSYVCDVYDDLDAVTPTRGFGVVDGRLVADARAYERSRHLDGACPIQWRQGMKHDAARVMELPRPAGPAGPSTDRVEIEESYLYPLLKGTDVFRGRTRPHRWVVVPQRSLGEDTSELAHVAPKLWAYLNRNAEILDGRRSAIYRGRPRFCVFGIGDYSFAPYKIVVSGLHKSAEFRLVGPVEGRPVFVDDTCYLLPFHDPTDAAVVLALLQAPAVREFLLSLAFWDSKRPITKKLLQRIDLPTLATTLDEREVVDRARTALRALGIAGVDARITSALASAFGPPP